MPGRLLILVWKTRGVCPKDPSVLKMLRRPNPQYFAIAVVFRFPYRYLALRSLPPFTGVLQGPGLKVPHGVFFRPKKTPKSTQKALFGALRGRCPKLLKKHSVGHFQVRALEHSCKWRKGSQILPLFPRKQNISEHSAYRFAIVVANVVPVLNSVSVAFSIRKGPSGVGVYMCVYIYIKYVCVCVCTRLVLWLVLRLHATLHTLSRARIFQLCVVICLQAILKRKTCPSFP